MDNSRDKVVAVAEEEEAVTLPGFRFHPTDEELVAFYLRRKVEKKPIRIEIIKQVDIYKYDPWDLPRVSNVGDKEWYFFCPRGRKYRNSVRPNRVTGSGFWKATGIDRPIHAAGGGNHDCVGLKKSLVYYRGSAGKGIKTDWMMHEFRLPTGGGVNNNCTLQDAGETWTICRIFKRNVSYKRQAQAQSWRSSDTSSKQAPGGLSSKTCSAGESNSDDDHRRQQVLQPANWNFQQICDNNSVITGYEDKPETHTDQYWNSSSQTQSPSPVSYNGFPVPSVNDFLFRDGISWEELGRMAEFSEDPFPVYECKY
ncbi:hypothetical protein Taro_006098 [Colocasia esculenta]|uniref:NAC domain-containing protein n=1 Tax=Colocasia esculenta TaxID=4460 RepID=A0A843TRU0_COLES|nr:hypothetical protein [Colocasia esculenta]